MIKIFSADEILTLEGAHQKQGRQIKESDLSIIPKASLVTENGSIIWVGPTKKIPSLQKLSNKSTKATKVKEQKFTGCISPGFIECHTHSVFAGSRHQEFEMRIQGRSYQEIAQKGGGIISTMLATRKISKSELLKISQVRVDEFIRQGVTTLEIKSGYALDTKNEIKMLEVMKDLKGPHIVPTFMGAHAIPPEYKSGPAEKYLDYLADEIIPIVKKKNLAKRVDIFVEKGFFEKPQSKDYLRKLKSLGFDLVIHADQLTLSGGSDLAVELQAVSADHVIQLGDLEIQKLSKSEVTCVLLPLADLYMRCAYPPARKLIENGARVALATDFNPGTSPSQSLTTVGLLARLQMQMTLPEIIAAYTVAPSYALKLYKSKGSLRVGKDADFIVSSASWENWFYSIEKSVVEKTYSKSNLIS